MRSLKLAAGLVFGAVAAAAPARATEYNIAIVQSLSGPVAFIGAPLKDGMLMAIDEINSKGLLGAGNTVKATVDDDAADRGQALGLVARYGNDPKVLMMVGPTTGSIVVSAANAANDLKFPIYTTGNVPDVVKAGPWSWMITQPPFVTVNYIADYAVQKLKVKNCALVTINDNEAYVTLTKIYQDIVTKGGVKIASYDGVKQSDSDFSALAVKVVGEKPDCLFVSTPPTLAANIITQFKQAGLDPATQIMGHTSLASPDLVKMGGTAVDGVYLIADWMPGGSSDAGKAFAAAYQQKYGKAADNWGPIGYSAMMVVATALKGAQPNVTRDSLRAAFEKTKDVPVIVGNGKYSFAEDRMPRYGINVMQVKGGAFVPAP